MLLRNTGLRVNKLPGLQVRDFVLGGPAFIVYVIRSKKAERTEYRPIYINPDIGVQLRDYLRVHDYKLMEQVFRGGENKRDPRKIIARVLRFVFEAAGLASMGRKVKPKDFRGFLTQTMTDGGVPMAITSKMMGHVSEQTTKRITKS